MTPQIKRLFDKFCIAVTVIVAITMILCGKTMAEERGEQILQGTEYKSVMLESGESTISVQVDEGEVVFNKDALMKLLDFRRFIAFTPFNSVAYFIRCAEELILS